jgi:hypothetical protein
MTPRLFLLFLPTFFCLVAKSQVNRQESLYKKSEERAQKRERINQLIRNEEEGVPSFAKHTIFSIKTHHDGYGLLLEKGFSKTAYKSTLFQLEISEKQHPKEEKLTKTDYSNTGFAFFGRPFVYGKQNIFYQAKLGAGQQRLIGGKGNKNGVAVYAMAVGGFSAGLARPYYIEFDINGNAQKLKYSEENRELFFTEEIIGGTGLQVGWNEMKFIPGVYGKAGLRFDWARFNQVISAIEFGFGFDFFTQKVVQMVDNPGKNFFPTGYIGLVFGKRK